MRVGWPLYSRLLSIILSAIFAAAAAATLQAQPNKSDKINRLYADGKYLDALPVAERYVSFVAPYEHTIGKKEEYYDAIRLLARIYQKLGRYAEAEALFVKRYRFVSLREASWDMSEAQTDLVQLFLAMGQFADAEPNAKAALYNTRRALGLMDRWGNVKEPDPDNPLKREDPRLGIAFVNLADVYLAQGRFGEAAPLYARAISIYELNFNYSWLGTPLNGLGEIYREQGQYEKAEPFHLRALSIDEKELAAEHPNLGWALNYLGALYKDQRRYVEAKSLHRRALSNYERGLGPDHAWVGMTLSHLADVYRAQDRYADAEPLYMRALSIYEKALGREYFGVGRVLNNQGLIYSKQGRYSYAEVSLHRGLAILEKALGAKHPYVIASLNDLAGLYIAQDNWIKAAEYLQRSTKDISRQASDYRRKDVQALVKVLHQMSSAGNGVEPDLQRKAFVLAQQAQSSEAAISLAQLAARAAKTERGSSDYRLRRHQDLLAERRRLDPGRMAELGLGRDKRAADDWKITMRLAAIDIQLKAVEDRMGHLSWEYQDLDNPRPLTIEQVQALLDENEALVVFFDTPALYGLRPDTYIWVVTKAESHWLRSEAGPDALSVDVAALRCGLDETAWNDATDWPDTSEEEVREKSVQTARRQRCKALTGVEAPSTELVGLYPVKVLPFDSARAHGLYRMLFGQVERLIGDKQIFVIASPSLHGLPLSILLTEPPATAMPATLAAYRDLSWLGIRRPITMLPSVNSLQFLRKHAKASRATKRYVGIGNPLLDGRVTESALAHSARERQSCFATTGRPLPEQPRSRRSPGSFQSLSSNVQLLREISPLPETAEELCLIAESLGVPESDILLGSRATEAALKALSFKDYAVVHFATHGVLAGELRGFSEPGLILTPPQGALDHKMLELDDGFLAASEIAKLKLDADWVILSACNTAGGRENTAEPLSGMAQAFFHAGARAVLVSHWEVNSHAAVKLMTRVLAELETDPHRSRAEALRLSMRAMIETGKPFEAHPMQWAPFSLVGEGAARYR